MFTGLVGFFSNWTARHWINFGIFLFGGMTATLGITASTPWSDLPKLFTPLTTFGMIVSILGFMLQTATNSPRDPTVGTRSTDPLPTAAIVEDRRGQAVPIPPATPGRPTEPEPPKEP